MSVTFVTSNQGRPIQGVSQQPEKNRLPGQCTESINFRPDVVESLVERAGTKELAELIGASQSTNSKWHYYKRDTEEYVICIEASGSVRVWSLDGLEHIVNVEDNTEASYLATGNPAKDLKALTISDFTFFVNRNKFVQESTTVTPSPTPEAILYVQFIDYSQTLIVYVDDVKVATLTTPDGSVSTDKFHLQPWHIVGELMLALTGNTGGSARESTYTSFVDLSPTFNLTAVDNTIVMSRIDGGDFSVSIDDSADNKNSAVIKGKLSNTQLLPGRAPEGFLVEIDPPGGSKLDNSTFWLKAVNTESDHVTWQETIAPGVSVGFDTSTAPHVLVRESINGSGQATFTLREGEWEDRKVGNDSTNPIPSFVNERINMVGVVQNRLYFTAGENVVCTRTGDFFNFFRQSAQASLDTDPIDVYADSPSTNVLKSSASFEGDLIFFSDRAQFLLDVSKPLVAKTATLRQVTEFNNIIDVDPVASGDSIIFSFKYGNFAGVREFFTDSLVDTKKAKPITDHVKKYVQGLPTIMKTATSLNVLCLKTDSLDNTLFVYDWLWQGVDKVQSAWGKFQFGEDDKVLYFEFRNEKLLLVMLRDGTNVVIEELDLGDPPEDVIDFRIKVDRQKKIDWTWDAAEQRWYCSDPFPAADVDTLWAVISGHGGANGDSLDETEGVENIDVGVDIAFIRDGNMLYSEDEFLEGVVANQKIETIMGYKINFEYTPTNPVAIDQHGLPLEQDFLTVNKIVINYNSSGGVKITITRKSGQVKTKDYGYRVLGSPGNKVGFAELEEGVHNVPIHLKSDSYTLTLQTDSYLPLEIRDFEFNGLLSRRGLRL